jgi:hypothetical protein
MCTLGYHLGTMGSAFRVRQRLPLQLRDAAQVTKTAASCIFCTSPANFEEVFDRFWTENRLYLAQATRTPPADTGPQSSTVCAGSAWATNGDFTSWADFRRGSLLLV